MNVRTALFMQSIRGPVVLITVGALFAIHQAGILSFGRTWPMLFIVIGVMKLLERAFAPATPLQTPYSNAAAPQYGAYANAGYAPYGPNSQSQAAPQPSSPPVSTSSPGGTQQ